jgi:hypothetical protein
MCEMTERADWKAYELGGDVVDEKMGMLRWL